MTNKVTFKQYEESTDEYTLHLDNENQDQTIDAGAVYELWEQYRNGEKLGHLDTALAKIYDDAFEDDPRDLVGQSAEF